MTEHPAGYPPDYRPPMVRALIIAVDRRWRVAEIGTDLRTYQEVVQAFVTIYHPSKEWRLYCDDATGMNRPPADSHVNRLATELAEWADPQFRRDILGNAVIVGIGTAGQDIDVPTGVLRHLEGEL